MNTKTHPIKLFFDDNQKLEEFRDIIYESFICFDDSLELEYPELRADYQSILYSRLEEEYLVFKLSTCFNEGIKGTVADLAFKLYRDGKVEVLIEESFHCLGPSIGLHCFLESCLNNSQEEMIELYKYLKRRIYKVSRQLDELTQ